MKLFGVLFLSLIPVIIGLDRRQKLLWEGKKKDALIRFFTFVKFRIETFNHPQKKIFRDFTDPILEQDGFLPTLKEEVEKDPCGAMARVVLPLAEENFFSQTEREALSEFARFFGMVSKEVQLKDLEKLLFLLRGEEEKNAPNRMHQASLARSIGLCSGLGIFILLI